MGMGWGDEAGGEVKINIEVNVQLIINLQVFHNCIVI